MSTVDFSIHLNSVTSVTGISARLRAFVVSAAEFARFGVGLVRMWAERRRQQAELLDYLASDHRAAADVGLKSIDFDWSNGPFGRNKSRIFEIPSLGAICETSLIHTYCSSAEARGVNRHALTIDEPGCLRLLGWETAGLVRQMPAQGEGSGGSLE